MSGFTAIMQLHKRRSEMKKLIIFALLLMFALSVPLAEAADWSKYESGRNNIRLDGYDGQPGYVEFTDGNGNTTGYLFMTSGGVLKRISPGAIDLTTTKLNSDTSLAVTVQ